MSTKTALNKLLGKEYLQLYILTVGVEKIRMKLSDDQLQVISDLVEKAELNQGPNFQVTLKSD